MNACSGCAPHLGHYWHCYNLNGLQSRCECKVELPPLPFKEGADWEGPGGTDDQHEDWLEFGESQDWLARERAEREKLGIE